MCLIVFDYFRRQRDPILLDVAPFQFADFAASLAGEDEELDDGPERMAVPLGGAPHGNKLVVCEDALARMVLCWLLHAFHRRTFQVLAANRPSKECLCDCVRVRGLSGRLEQPVDDDHDVMRFDVGELSVP